MKPETATIINRYYKVVTERSFICLLCVRSSDMCPLPLQLQTKDLEIQLANTKLQEQAELVDRAEVQSKKMSEAFAQMQSHKLETDKLLESYNERFSECQHSIEKSNEVSKILGMWASDQQGVCSTERAIISKFTFK